MNRLPEIPERLACGAQIGSGGEGRVFAVAGRPDLALKIYHKPPSARRVAKLKAMADKAEPGLIAFAAWPLKVLEEIGPGGVGPRGVGVAMPRLQSAFEINLAYAPKARAKHFPEADWRFLLRVAANVAAAFANVHDLGYVVGDVNQSSVLVRADATIALIDCDSFQFEHGDAFYPCEVAVPMFTPPELQGRDPASVRRTPDHDGFGLAVLVFLLLFMGRHPFAGRPRAGEDLPIEKAIAARQFAYSRRRRSPRLAPPPNSLGLADLPQSLADLFEQAFCADARPTPAAWHHALSALERDLRACRIEPSHRFPSGLSHCPWCVIERASGATLFRKTPAAPRARTLVTPPDFAEAADLWAPIEAAFLRRQPSLPPRASASGLAPSPAVQALSAARTHDPRVFGGVTLASGLALVFGAGLAAAAAAPIAVSLGVAALALRGVRARKALRVLQDAHAAALAACETLESDVSQFARQGLSIDHAALVRARDRYEALVRPWLTLRDDAENRWRDAVSAWRNQTKAAARGIRKRILLSQGREPQMKNEELVATFAAQLQSHLDAHLIADAAIEQIGPSRVATLRSFQVESAGDVTRKALRAVPGFGEHLSDRLLRWRGKVERAFEFDLAAAEAAIGRGAIVAASPPPRPAPPGLPEGTVDLIRSLEAELRSAPARIATAAVEMESALAQLVRDAEQASRVLAQAEADLAAAAG